MTQISDEQLFPDLRGQGMIAVDLETCDPELRSKGSGAHRGAFAAGLAIATEAGFSQYYPIRHRDGPNMDPAKVLGWAAEQMKIPVPKVGANLLYDIGFLNLEKCPPAGPFYDVQVAEPLIAEDRFSYSLEAIMQQRFGEKKPTDELDAWLQQRFGKKKSEYLSHIWEAPPDLVATRALTDVRAPLRIFKQQREEMERDNLWDLFTMESKLIPMLAAMRQRGVKINVPATEQMRDKFVADKAAVLAEVRRMTGVDVQIWAADSIARVFDSLNIPYPRTPKTDKPSFTAPFLEAQEHPVAGLIKEARRLDKMIGTFLEGGMLNRHHNGRLYTQFNQLRSDEGGTVSGRFSSQGPNLQFIPVRTDDGKRIRKLFLPDDGQLWYKLDYSQIEYVLMIHDAVTARLKGAREIADKYISDENADFHQLVAEMTGLSRSRAKTINFGLAYGEGVDKLCRQLGLTRQEGEDLIAQYHARAPFMKPLIQGCSGLAARTGEIRTLMNRRRTFNMWELSKWNKQTKSFDKVYLRNRAPGSKRAFTHKALNARTQGSAADIMKQAMVDAWESGVISVLGVPQLTVHDELDGSCPDTAEGREAVQELARIMERCVELSVPLRVDPELGPNWGETQALVSN
jgi:DNA polymerase-1